MKRKELEKLDKATLIDLVERQAERIASLEARLLEMAARLEEIERRAMRGAAPFSRGSGKPANERKRPGRRKGHEGFRREQPDDGTISERIDVLLERCPACDTPFDITVDRALTQWIVEIPPIEPRIVQLTTHRNRCAACSLSASSNHPSQVSGASGAASTHLGPRALAVAAWLRHGLGMTMRKTCMALRELLGISLSPGGLSQALDRMAGKLAGEREKLLARMKAEPVLHTDETSWFVGEPKASLWVLTNRAGTYYRIVSSRSKAAAIELMGDYQGALVSDCLNIYDDLTPTQQKCYAHHLKKISEALVGPDAGPNAGPNAGPAWLVELRGLLRGAMGLKAAQKDLSPDHFAKMRRALDASADRLLGTSRPGGEERIRKRIAKQRDHLFTFLDHESVDATNNLAERQLRPAVIARKLSCGNKTERGAETWQTLASIAATCAQTSRNFIDHVEAVMANGEAIARTG